MKPVQVISASAGSGKTSRLARHLAEEIREGRVRPEAVVAVTFTVKAAAELARRVREELLRYGKVDEARRLGAARIGTVHSVCGRLLSDFAFDLGLSPDLTVLDQESAAAALKRSLSSVVEREDEESLSELQSLFADLDLEEAARRIQEAARSNGVDAATLYASGEASVAELTKLLDGCGREIDGALWDAALVAALDTFLASVDLDLDTTKATKDARARVRSALAALRGTRRPAWQVFAGLANLETGKKSREHAAPVQALAADHDRHPLFRSDLARATRLAFSLAARSLSAYADYKRERGVVDFADQEALALRLLERPAVREQLEAEIDLVLVDEFQDTSPLQLALFLSLARLAKSAWVGDQKQAIYGFRGADPALMDAAIESLLGGDEPETLPKSWRSRPALVHVASELFVGAFGRQGLPEARVRL
ncbi:MAG TPA: UvrD-helicase domain-containing protein, partial [Thermoanaerobaculia bacterium]|nr:UvrD-helicase domain-containing protein [Thermoanaerobaculia bacterium]